MKDYIEIIDNNNNKRLVEIVTIFKLDGFDYNYIIYRETDGSHNYLAKYKGSNIVNLETDFSEEELKLSEIIYRSIAEWV